MSSIVGGVVRLQYKATKLFLVFNKALQLLLWYYPSWIRVAPTLTRLSPPLASHSCQVQVLSPNSQLPLIPNYIPSPTSSHHHYDPLDVSAPPISSRTLQDTDQTIQLVQWTAAKNATYRWSRRHGLRCWRALLV